MIDTIQRTRKKGREGGKGSKRKGRVGMGGASARHHRSLGAPAVRTAAHRGPGHRGGSRLNAGDSRATQRTSERSGVWPSSSVRGHSPGTPTAGLFGGDRLRSAATGTRVFTS